MGKRLCPPPAGLTHGPACGIASGLGCRVRSNFSHQAAAQEIAPPTSPVRRLCTRAPRAAGRSNRGVVLPRDRIPGNGPRHGSPGIVDYAGGISNWRDFLATAAVVRSTLGISPSAWGSAQTDIGEMSAAVVACILQRGAEFNSAGGYLRGLTRKSEIGVFSWPDPDGAD